MVTSEFSPGILLSAVEAAVVVATKECAVAQRRCEVSNDASLYSDDGLQVNSGSKARESLGAAENRRERIPDAVDDIAFGVGRNCLVGGYPAAWLARYVQTQDRLHELLLIDSSTSYWKIVPTSNVNMLWQNQLIGWLRSGSLSSPLGRPMP